MIELQIEVNSSDAAALNDLLSFGSSGMLGAALPNTAKAFTKSQHLVAKTWRDYLHGYCDLDGIEHIDKVNRSLIESVKERDNGDFDKTVYSNSQEMDKLVNGSPEVNYDMKKTHPYGRKSRVSKKGIPYLIIPFRWGTPNGKGTKRRWNNVIPQAAYNEILKGFQMSSTNGFTHVEKNAKGELIPRAEYSWKTRLTEDNAWDDRSVGMVRMKDSTKSTYWTFRVISAKSPKESWLYHRDGSEGIDIISALQRTLGDKITDMIESAIKIDEENLRNP